MTNPEKTTLPRNPETHAKHRREVFWQITLPLVVGTLLMLGACSLPFIVVNGGGDIGAGRDISLIWLLMPALVVSLIPLAILGASAYGVTRLIALVPGWMFILLGYFKKMNQVVRQFADRAVRPFIKTQEISSRAAVLLNWRGK